MAITDMVNNDFMNIKTTRSFFLFEILMLFFFLLHGTNANAINWYFRPSLTIEETYSDNINQDNDNGGSALVTEVSPGFTLSSRSSVNQIDLNYRMQNLYNAGGDSKLRIHNQLQFNSHFELLRKSLYLDADSTISQQNISNRNIVSDNLSNSNSNSNVMTFNISPYWTPHFKEYADGEVRVGYNRVVADDTAANLSNSHSLNQSIRLNSGRFFKRINWNVSFENREQRNSTDDNIQFQNSQAEIRTFFFNRDLNVFARIGHSENNFETNISSSRNGFSYTFGGLWRPSQRFSLQAGYGNNVFVTVNISPHRRLNWSTTYFNNDIGLNNGERWQTSINYDSRNSIWSFNYSENTVTAQQVLLEQQVFTLVDQFGETILNPLTGQPLLFARDLPTLTDEVFITKRADLSVSFRTGKSFFTLNGYRERREFQESLNHEDVYGANTSWNWNFERRTSSNTRLLWQATEGQDSTKDQRFEASLGVTHNISRYLNGRLQYRFINQQSDLAQNEFTENRVSFSLTVRY